MSTGRKTPWDEILRRKEEFVGGQVLCAEPLPGSGGMITRYEIVDIRVNGREVLIETAWGAISGGGNAWYKLNTKASIFGNATEPMLYADGGFEFGITYISGSMTLYPKDHESNIPLESVVDEAA